MDFIAETHVLRQPSLAQVGRVFEKTRKGLGWNGDTQSAPSSEKPQGKVTNKTHAFSMM